MLCIKKQYKKKTSNNIFTQRQPVSGIDELYYSNTIIFIIYLINHFVY